MCISIGFRNLCDFALDYIGIMIAPFIVNRDLQYIPILKPIFMPDKPADQKRHKIFEKNFTVTLDKEPVGL